MKFTLNHEQYLLLIKRYNIFKVLVCSTTLFHLSLFCVTFFQLHTFMLLISSKTSSSQRNLGLPVGLLDMGFHLLIFFTLLSSAIRSTWPNQINLCFLIKNHEQYDNLNQWMPLQLVNGFYWKGIRQIYTCAKEQRCVGITTRIQCFSTVQAEGQVHAMASFPSYTRRHYTPRKD